MHNLTGIYWIKDEGRYLPEYLEYGLLTGFDHFIFFDNGSTDGSERILEPYINAGIVEIRTYPDGFRGVKNAWAMDYSLWEQTGKSRWIHFHAIDERLYSPLTDNCFDVLEEFWRDGNVGGAVVPWTLINSSGHITRPEGLIIENYTSACQDRMNHIKTIVHPDATSTMKGNPHAFNYEQDYIAVNENKNAIDGPFSIGEYPMEKLKLYHYLSLSKEEFEAKMNKGVLDQGTGHDSTRRPDADFQWDLCHNEAWLIGEDTTMVKYVEEVRQAINKRFYNDHEVLEYINH